MPELSSEDTKLVTLARATRARTGASEGAAVRDENGRTYAGASIALPSLRLSALQVCVAMAVSSGSRGLEAAVVLADTDAYGVGGAAPDLVAEADLAVVRDLGGDGVPVHRGDGRGTVNGTAVA